MSDSAKDPRPPASQLSQSEDARYLLYGQIAEQIQSAHRSGLPIDLDALVAEHPDMAREIREFAAAMSLLAEVGPEEEGDCRGGEPETTSCLRGRLGDFRIVCEIGRGGMGVVYEAEQISLGRRLALKVLPFAATLDPRQLQRFRNEAQAAAALKHPHIVGIHSVGCERGVHYFAMEFIEGRTLAQLIEEVRHLAGLGETAGKAVEVSQVTQSMVAGQFSQDVRKPGDNDLTVAMDSIEPTTAQADETHRRATASDSTKGPHRTNDFFRLVAQLGIQAAEALDHAHQVGVVHRDIKPSNLMVDANRHLWITDFGLAITQTDPGLTMTGDIVGTLRYMSPEQALGDRRRMDHRTDVYSLGITLYEFLALQPAFGGDGRETLVRRLVEEDPPAPRSINPAIPRDLETIVLKATSKDPQQRYAVAQDLADDLKRFLADKPICARRATLGMRAVKWAKRHRPTVWSAIVLTVIAAVTAAGLAWNQHRQSVQLAADVGEHLAAADAFLQSADYPAVDRELAGARGRLETAGYGNGPLADEVTRLADELHARQQAIERFDQFQKLRHRIHSEMYAVDRTILDQAQGHCRSALDLYQVMASDSWKQPRDFQDLSPERQASLEEGLVELLFVSARLEIDESDGQTSAELQAAHRRAVDAFSKIQSIHKPIPAVYLWIAESWEALGEKTAAAQARAQAEALRPATAMDHFLLGEHHGQHGRLDQAVASYWQALARQPDHFLSLLAAGVALGELKKHESAEAMLTGAIAMNPQTVLGYVKRGASRLEQGRILLAQADFQKARTIDPDLAGALVRRASEFRTKGDFEKALAECSEAIRIDPKSAWAYVARGGIYFDQGALYKSIDDLNCAIRLDPGSVMAYWTRACVYRNMGRSAESLADAEECIRLDRKNALGYFGRGLVCMDRGELDKALADLNEGLRLCPNDSGAFCFRGDIYCHRGDLEKALSDFEKAVQLNPKNPWGYMSCAAIRQVKGDSAKALADYNEAVRVGGPQYGVPYLYRARFHRDRGNFDEAMADYKDTFRASPTWLGVVAIDESASMYLDKGDVASAAAVYDQVKDFGTNPDLHRNRAEVRFRAQRYADALADLAIVVELMPHDTLLWIPPEQVAKCPDERLRKGLLELADKTIEKTKGAAEAYATRARLHAAFGQPEKALADFAKAIELEPNNPKVWNHQVIFHAEQGQWEKVLADFDKAVALRPEQANLWYRRALARLGQGQADQYRKDCAEMLQRFGQTTKPNDAYWVAWTCALAPDAIKDWPKAVALAEKSAKSDPQSASFLNTLGAVLYRAGRFDESLQRLTDADRFAKQPSRSDMSLPAYTWFFLAMAHHRLGHSEEAKQWLDKAEAWTEKAIAEADQGIEFMHWNRRLTLKLLRDEAEALLKSAPAPQPPDPAAKEKEKPEEKPNAES